MGEIHNLAMELAKEIQEVYLNSNRSLKELIAEGKELINNRTEKYE